MEPENLLRLINAGHIETALKNMPGASDIYLDFLTQNGIGLGEVAEPKSQIEKLNLIIKNEC